MKPIEHSPLGREVAYADQYDPGLLFPIDRAAQRARLGLGGALPFRGVDLWTAYELSWLDGRGKPVVAIGEFRIPADSPAIIESKSLKLYLNGYAQLRLPSPADAERRLADDLSAACGSTVGVRLLAGAAMDVLVAAPLSGASIDDLDVAIDNYGPPDPQLLRADADRAVDETLVSRLLRSNCPVTGQPDWADVQVRYRGPAIEPASLLRYLVSYRRHCEFHESCVERIFVDLKARCRPQALTVYARFTRRGGLDINPWRSDDPVVALPNNVRTARQ